MLLDFQTGRFCVGAWHNDAERDRRIQGFLAMMVKHDREKLIQAVVFFAANTLYCGKIKLIKLLYLMDFEHFRQTGRSVTGLEYRAWKMGPVPVSLFQEWDVPDADLAAAISITPEQIFDYTRQTVVPVLAFDDSHFTRRELRIMHDLAQRLRESLSKPMVDLTHRERGPWETIWDAGRGNDMRIPYSLSVPDDDPNRGAVLASEREYAALDAAWTH